MDWSYIMGTNILCEAPSEKIRVARFLRPDVREALNHYGHEYDDIARSGLYQELHTGTLASFPEGGTLILNFGLIDVLTSAFYRLLLRTQEEVRAKSGRLFLCCLTDHSHEAFALMGGLRTFATPFSTEARAISEAKK